MILGIGTDMADARRIARTLARFGERFERRVFTPGERAKAQSRRQAGAKIVASTYAKRFAAKEACAKALGTGIGQGISWQEIEVVNSPGGQPELRLYGNALPRLQALTPPGYQARLHLSLADETHHALAFVVVEGVPFSCGLA